MSECDGISCIQDLDADDPADLPEIESDPRLKLLADAILASVENRDAP